MMKTINNTIVLEDCSGYSPTVDGVFYTDITGVKIFIPIKLLIELHDGTKEYLERNGIGWEPFCNELFEKNESIQN